MHLAKLANLKLNTLRILDPSFKRKGLELNY